MKYLFLICATLLMLRTANAQTWKWSQAPRAGSSVELTLTELPEADGPLHVACYYFEGTKLNAHDAGLVEGDSPGEYRIPVVVPEASSWIGVAVKDKNNDIIAMTHDYAANEKAEAKAWAVEKALALGLYSRNVGLERNDIEATTMFRDAVITNPNWMNQPDVLRVYYQVAKSAAANEDLNNIKVHLTNISLKPKDVSEALLVQSTRIAKAMADSTLHASLRKGLDKAYPKSILMQEEMFQAFRKATTTEEKIKLKNDFTAKYGVTDENRRMVDQMTSTIAQDYSIAGNWDQVLAYVNQISDPMTKASTCNTFAWTLSGESVDNPGSHYDVAEQLSAMSLKLLSPDAPKPASVTKSEWLSNLEYQKAQFGDTYALIRYKQGHVDDALDHQLYAVQKNEYADGELNERYAVYLEKAGQHKELEAFMDKIMAMGKGTAKIKEIHKNYWTQQASSGQLYQQYLHQLDTRAEEYMTAKVAKGWKDEESFPFTLKDLQGNTVSLSDYKGKTVVLDFWATWCGPCKASFPGMKKAVEHFASDKDVAFLFIDTWENKENMEARVSGFIKDNNYPFHVLLDAEDKVVTDYKVGGIPTKFVIGPDQKVRFISVGFSGNNDELAEELRIMIKLAKNGGAAVRS
jgi:thiol-disulfide isomerase/thioredoxin